MAGKKQQRNDIQYSRERFNCLSVRDRLGYLCQVGHLAPSSHNTQPWRFKLNENKAQIVLFFDRNFILPESDCVGRQTLVGMGCCLENILEAAANFGLQCKVFYAKFSKKECLPIIKGGKRYTQVAEINFESLEAVKGPTENFFNEIFSRQVVRAEFDPEVNLPKNLVEDLAKFTDGKKIKLHTLKRGILSQSIAEFQGQADNYVINSKVFSRELGDWLLPNDSKSYLGMPGAGFGLSDVQAKRLHLGLSGKQPLEPEDGLKFSLSGKMFLEKSPLICLLTVEKDEPELWLSAGVVLEKMLLFLQRQNLSVALHAAIAEVGLINKLFMATLGTTRKLTALFRVGKIKNPDDLFRPFSPRLPLEDIFLD